MFECRGCGESVRKRSAKVFCSNACQRAAERRLKVATWLKTGQAHAGSHPDHYVRSYIRDAQENRCAICSNPPTWNGLPLAFVLDHIDGDASNNWRHNLRLLCPNCDSQLPTYKNRNLGRGRHSRRQRYAEGKSY